MSLPAGEAGGQVNCWGPGFRPAVARTSSNVVRASSGRGPGAGSGYFFFLASGPEAPAFLYPMSW